MQCYNLPCVKFSFLIQHLYLWLKMYIFVGGFYKSALCTKQKPSNLFELLTNSMYHQRKKPQENKT